MKNLIYSATQQSLEISSKEKPHLCFISELHLLGAFSTEKPYPTNAKRLWVFWWSCFFERACSGWKAASDTTSKSACGKDAPPPLASAAREHVSPARGVLLAPLGFIMRPTYHFLYFVLLKSDTDKTQRQELQSYTEAKTKSICFDPASLGCPKMFFTLSRERLSEPTLQASATARAPWDFSSIGTARQKLRPSMALPWPSFFLIGF